MLKQICISVVLFFYLSCCSLAQNLVKENYSGILPCADCEGLQTNLMLKKNNEYEISYTYLGKSSTLQTKLGKFSEANNGIIHLLGLRDTLFTFRKTQEGVKLQFVDEQGLWKDIARYNLLKRVGHSNAGTANELQGIWELQKLDNKELKSFLFEGEIPFLQFHFNNLMLEGNTGCNDLSGNFSQQNNELKFSKNMSTTRMFCENSAEKLFLDLLRCVVRFERKENSLLLYCDDGRMMAFGLKGD
jgi:copper homeostasis protein (lipoprotein)